MKSRLTNLGRLKVRAGEESWFTHIYKSNSQETSYLGQRIYLGIHLPEQKNKPLQNVCRIHYINNG